MARQDEQEQYDRWKAMGIRTDIPHPARVYDYLLGGKDNFSIPGSGIFPLTCG
jgi:hypothetical protein